MHDDDFLGDGHCGMSIHIISMGSNRKAAGFPYDQGEGFDARENYMARAEREKFFSRSLEDLYEGRDNLKIDGHELSEGRGYIQTPSSPYFPNFY
jgi:hypothetical protein